MSGSGLDAVLPLLACPHCPQPLTRQGAGVVGCETGHRFDMARQGYLSLLGSRSRTDTGDSADMVEARAEFLGAGHYRPIADAIARQGLTRGPVLEIGAGTGYYLAIALDGLRANGSGPTPAGWRWMRRGSPPGGRRRIHGSGPSSRTPGPGCRFAMESSRRC